MKCLRCDKEHDGSFATGKFCSRGCANTRNHSTETKSKIGLRRRIEIPTCSCVECGNSFQKRIRKGRKIVCDDCIRKVIKYRDGDFSLMDLSSRTIPKIFKRAQIGCAICGWKESTGDVHHIVEKKNCGTDEISNLIYVCPNHHRIIHSEKKYDREFLTSRSLLIQLPNWKDFYNFEANHDRFDLSK